MAGARAGGAFFISEKYKDMAGCRVAGVIFREILKIVSRKKFKERRKREKKKRKREKGGVPNRDRLN
ncbi:MAG: hypothetical protein A2Z83_07915 [Omnitrophica bacterium GWA2_52_8]|nr:MAG: hypothetical protein A2Z83_07915 [Omnitrophica bacterium GWA2_52_8]